VFHFHVVIVSILSIIRTCQVSTNACIVRTVWFSAGVAEAWCARERLELRCFGEGGERRRVKLLLGEIACFGDLGHQSAKIARLGIAPLHTSSGAPRNPRAVAASCPTAAPESDSSLADAIHCVAHAPPIRALGCERGAIRRNAK
jgi:hypothetical protein